MPTCRRKRVLLTEPSEDLKSDVTKDVYLLSRTGEIFDSYEAYAARMTFYNLKQFQCEVTGRSGLTYFQAVESEQEEARTLHSRFPEPLKAAVLKSVQWQVMGRLDNLVEAVYERYRDRYFEGEKVFLDVQGDKFSARIAQVYPPKSHSLNSRISDAKQTPQLKRKRSSSDTPDTLSPLSDVPGQLHSIGGNLKISLKESLEKDDPIKYFYKVQILEEDKSPSRESNTGVAHTNNIRPERRESGRVKEKLMEKSENFNESGPSDYKTKWSGSLMEVQCNVMSRDRLTFSKSLLRRFLRDCLDRDSSLASPWTVKPAIAGKYDLSNKMPDDIRVNVQKARQGEIDKRKKIWEEKELQAEKEGRYTKKMKKRDEREQKAAVKAAEQEARKQDTERKAALAAKAKEEKVAAEQAAKQEAERLAMEKAKKKKKPLRYPTEDLDIKITDKDKRNGMRLRRPSPSRGIDKLPFNNDRVSLEGFLLTWNFLNCFSQPLHLSSFTMDEYEHALQHSLSNPPCNLIAEIHSVLIYNLRTIPFQRHAAVLSLLKEKDLGQASSDSLVGIDKLLEAMVDVGNNWERIPLKHGEDRQGWEEALVGCLKDHATVQSFPKLRHVLNHLLFDMPDQQPPSASATPLPWPTLSSNIRIASPSERYYYLSAEERVAILRYMCDLAVSSKAIHSYMESCEEQLTSLRKEKIEVNRQKKMLQEDMAALIEVKDGKTEDDSGPHDLSDLESEGQAISEDASESGSFAGLRPSSAARQLTLRLKVQQGQAHAKQRELARAKEASVKQALAEHRRLDEEVNKLERKLEYIERDFRKLLGTVRVKPLGRDRFYNRYWWFDGCGGSVLMGTGGVVLYGTGRLFIQGPSEFDIDILQRRIDENLMARRKEEEGDVGILGVGEWGVYTDIEDIEALLGWLNPKGNRELVLRNALQKWWDHLAPGVRKRTADVNTTARLPEARRSTRGKSTTSDISREPYMLWSNRKASN